MAAKRVIVNADGLGRSRVLDGDVLRAHRDGIVTSATLVVGGEAAASVPRLAAESPNLGIGLHLAFSSGDPAEALAQARAQLKRFRELMGRDPTHFAGPDPAQLAPAVEEAQLTLAWETGRPVRAASPPLAERLRREGIKTTDRVAQAFRDEGAGAAGLVRLLDDILPGASEITWRPGFGLDALTSYEARQSVQAGGIRLIHFGQL